MATTVFPDNIRVAGNITRGGSLLPSVSRSELTQEQLAIYTISFTDLRVWDAMATLLPGTPATDDLGLNTGTLGTNFPTVRTEDLKAAGATNKYASFLFQMPPEYDATADVQIKVSAGMITTVADTTATIDFVCYKSDRDGAVGADLVSTAAQSINSLTFADLTFTITSSGLAAGDILQIRMHLAINDSASGTAVIGCVGDLAMLLDIRG